MTCKPVRLIIGEFELFEKVICRADWNEPLILSDRCFHGGDDDCDCEDPTEPNPRDDAKGWMDNHLQNKEKAEAVVASGAGVDVVFLGDQFVQAWDGHFMNRKIVGADDIQLHFRETFSRASGGMVDGMALGIAGDTTSNLLWRIQNGEIPEGLNPKGRRVAWI